MTGLRIGNAQSQINERRQTELDSRRAATRFLQPHEVGAKLSAARLLTTTLGGPLRPITPVDLKIFKASVANLGGRARQGLTAEEALRASIRIPRTMVILGSACDVCRQRGLQPSRTRPLGFQCFPFADPFFRSISSW